MLYSINEINGRLDALARWRTACYRGGRQDWIPRLVAMMDRWEHLKYLSRREIGHEGQAQYWEAYEAQCSGWLAWAREYEPGQEQQAAEALEAAARLGQKHRAFADLDAEAGAHQRLVDW